MRQKSREAPPATKAPHDKIVNRVKYSTPAWPVERAASWELNISPAEPFDLGWSEFTCSWCGRSHTLTAAGQLDQAGCRVTATVLDFGTSPVDWRRVRPLPAGYLACLDCGAWVPLSSGWCTACGGPEPRQEPSDEEGADE